MCEVFSESDTLKCAVPFMEKYPKCHHRTAAQTDVHPDMYTSTYVHTRACLYPHKDPTVESRAC